MNRQVAAFVSARVGLAVATVADLAGSVANQDFLATLADRTKLVIKVGPRSELAAEAWSCRRLAALGVPVPKIVHLALDDGVAGEPTLILSFLPGVASEDPGVMRQAGRVMRQIHGEVQLNGGGPLTLSSEPPRGQHGTWGEAVLDQLSGLPELVDGGILDADLADRARGRVAVPQLLDYDGPGVLLHHDLKPAHLFAVDGRLTGIIDWGDASVGDPLGDLARLSMTGPTALAAFADGYGITVTPGIAETLARYRILWNVGALSYEYRAGGDWFAVYRHRIIEDVGAVSP